MNRTAGSADEAVRSSACFGSPFTDHGSRIFSPYIIENPAISTICVASPSIPHRGQVAIHLCLALTCFLFTGLSAARIVVTLYALELGAPASVVGTLGALFYLFALLLSWPVGALVDRAGAR